MFFLLQYLLAHVTPESVTEAAIGVFRSTFADAAAASAVWGLTYDAVTAPQPATLSVEDASAMGAAAMLYHTTMFEAGARAHACLVVIRHPLLPTH